MLNHYTLQSEWQAQRVKNKENLEPGVVVTTTTSNYRIFPQPAEKINTFAVILLYYLELCSHVFHMISFFNCNVAPVGNFNGPRHAKNLHL